jgi:hypothetical protein
MGRRSDILSKRKETRSMALVPNERLIKMYKNLDREFSLRDLQKESLRVLYKLRRSNHFLTPSAQCSVVAEKCTNFRDETNRDNGKKGLSSKSRSNLPTNICTTNLHKKQGSQRTIADKNLKIKQAAWMEAYKTKRSYTLKKPINKAKKSSF